MKIQEQAFTEAAFIQLDNVTLDLDELAHDIEQIFHEHGVSHVLRVRHNKQFPFYELHFSSEDALEQFLREKEEADLKLEDSISFHISSTTTATDPSPDLQILTHLFFVVPQTRTQKTQLQLVTAGNNKQVVTKFKESFSFTLQPNMFKDYPGL